MLKIGRVPVTNNDTFDGLHLKKQTRKVYFKNAQILPDTKNTQICHQDLSKVSWIFQKFLLKWIVIGHYCLRLEYLNKSKILIKILPLEKLTSRLELIQNLYEFLIVPKVN